MRKSLAVLAMPLVLIACSNSKNGSSAGGTGAIMPGQEITSEFIDAPVKGLHVKRSASNTITGDGGKFTCKSGEELEFWLGAVSGKGLLLGKANCGSSIYVDDLGAKANVIGSLIQSLSTGDTANRTTLDLTAFNATNHDLSASNISSITADGDIAAIVTAVSDLDVTHVNLADARTHMDRFLPDLSDDSVLEMAAASLANRTVTLNQTSGPTGGEDCWEKVSAELELETLGKSYRLNIKKFIGHDQEVDPNDATTCRQPNQDHDDVEDSVSGGWYDCVNGPAPSKIIPQNSPRSFGSSAFYAVKFAAAAGDTIVCYNPDANENENSYWMGSDCTTPYLPIKADKAYSFDINYGYTYWVNLSDNAMRITFVENNFDLFPDDNTFNEENETVGLKSKSYSCGYTFSEELELTESPEVP